MKSGAGVVAVRRAESTSWSSRGLRFASHTPKTAAVLARITEPGRTTDEAVTAALKAVPSPTTGLDGDETEQLIALLTRLLATPAARSTAHRTTDRVCAHG